MKNFWNNKKILITGINGFIGGNLCKKLISYGASVTGLIRNKNQKTLLFAEKLDKKVNLIQGNLENKNTLKRILLEQNIEICFHLAAQVEVGVHGEQVDCGVGECGPAGEPRAQWPHTREGGCHLLERVSTVLAHGRQQRAVFRS